MKELLPTPGRVALFVWSIMWRWLLTCILFALVVGLALNFIAISEQRYFPSAQDEWVMNAAVFVFSLFMLFVYVGGRIGKRIGAFRVIMVEAEPWR